jgi:ribonuclease D
VISELAERHTVLAQNLLPSDIVRALAWQPPPSVDEDAVRARLVELGARRWQLELTAAGLASALSSVGAG